MTWMVSPAFRPVLIQFENVPPRTRRTPTRSSPSSSPAQIEYDRRRSCPSIRLRNVRYCPWMKPKVSRSSCGTSKHTTTASLVSGSIERTRSGWKITLMGSDRLEVLERFQACQTAVQRLAGGGPKRRHLRGLTAAAPRAGNHHRRAAASDAGGGDSRFGFGGER